MTFMSFIHFLKCRRNHRKSFLAAWMSILFIHCAQILHLQSIILCEESGQRSLTTESTQFEKLFFFCLIFYQSFCCIRGVSSIFQRGPSNNFYIFFYLAQFQSIYKLFILILWIHEFILLTILYCIIILLLKLLKNCLYVSSLKQPHYAANILQKKSPRQFVLFKE